MGRNMKFEKVTSGVYRSMDGAFTIRGTRFSAGRSAVSSVKGPWFISRGSNVKSVAVAKTLNEAKEKVRRLPGMGNAYDEGR